jgi:UDP-N-acetylmuramoylalanine--D-glutamate ligase
MNLSAKRITVAGLGRFGGGIAVTQWLCKRGAKVLVTDLDPAEKLRDSLRQLQGLPVEFRLGGHRESDFTDTDLVVASPAIPPDNLFLAAAKSKGVPITTEIRLFIERCPTIILGVTGTKGKSTTTTLLGKMLSTKFTTWVGGNIGKSLLLDLEKIKSEDLVVLELSSYMLEHLREARWSPHIAVVTILLPDHIPWHKTAEAYFDSKKNILRYQKPDDWLVLNEDDPSTAGLAREAQGKTLLFGLQNRRWFELKLPGTHNQLNAQGAFAAASIMGIDWDDAERAIRDFSALPHRLQFVHESAGVRYYNDSNATIPDAAIAALESFPSKKVIQIIGGSDKGLEVTDLCAALIQHAKAVLCIGQTGTAIAEILEQSSSQSAPAIYRCGDLATAMTIARQIATKGDVVLLSPGFASFGQFVNFEQRGEEFTRLAKQQ